MPLNQCARGAEQVWEVNHLAKGARSNHRRGHTDRGCRAIGAVFVKEELAVPSGRRRQGEQEQEDKSRHCTCQSLINADRIRRATVNRRRICSGRPGLQGTTQRSDYTARPHGARTTTS